MQHLQTREFGLGDTQRGTGTLQLGGASLRLFDRQRLTRDQLRRPFGLELGERLADLAELDLRCRGGQRPIELGHVDHRHDVAGGDPIADVETALAHDAGRAGEDARALDRLGATRRIDRLVGGDRLRQGHSHVARGRGRGRRLRRELRQRRQQAEAGAA